MTNKEMDYLESGPQELQLVKIVDYYSGRVLDYVSRQHVGGILAKLTTNGFTPVTK